MDMQDYVSSFFNQIKQLHDLSKKVYPYRLLEVVDLLKNSHTVFKVQLAGKSTIFEMKACEIAGDDALLQGFSPNDIRIIIYFATKQTLTPTYRVESQIINNETGEMSFNIYDGQKVVCKTASEISSDPTLLNKLHTVDAHMIGYQYGSESFFKEKNQINLIKEKK